MLTILEILGVLSPSISNSNIVKLSHIEPNKIIQKNYWI